MKPGKPTGQTQGMQQHLTAVPQMVASSYVRRTRPGLSSLSDPLRVQVILAFAARPAPDAPLRGAWNLGHHNWGRLTSALAIANVFMGVVLFTHVWIPPDKQSGNYVKWLVPICAVLGVQLVAEAILQLVRHGIICKCCVTPAPVPGKSTSFGDHRTESDGVEIAVVPNAGHGAAAVPHKSGVAPLDMPPHNGASEWHQGGHA